MTDAAISTAALLAHTGWVRQLARRLVRDAHMAEDLAQDTLAIALERPPRASLPLRGWLSRVARNLVHQEFRTSARRTQREALAAQSEALPATGEVLERLGVFRSLVGHVDGLAEPFRSTIILRYFDELPPRRIAEQQGVPLKTVNSRLARGLERLRSALSKEHGAHEWLRLLAPLARAGGSPLSTALVWSSAASILALGALFWVARAGEPASEPGVGHVPARGSNSGGAAAGTRLWTGIDTDGGGADESAPGDAYETHRFLPYRERKDRAAEDSHRAKVAGEP